MRRSWLEIDREQLRNNYHIFKKQIETEQAIMAVVKADAYGHGDVEVAKVLMNEGVTDFAVANIEEAIKLRTGGIKGQILVLGYTPIECAKKLVEYDISQTILSEEYAVAISEQVKGLRVHFAIDTGMNRIGLDADNIVYCKKVVEKYSKVLCVEGLFTHLCDADNLQDRIFTQLQIEKFDRVVSELKHLDIKYVHCMNSAGGLWCKPYGNLVRLGIVLYGLKPSYDNELPKGIRPVACWKSVISMIKDVYPGESIGYGRTYVVKEPSRIATIPTGYADGYNRCLSNKGIVLINNVKAPLVGRVCMDQIMVDVSNIPEVNWKDEIFLLCNDYNADDMAHALDTIGYEVMCNISARVERVYKN